MSVVEVYYKGCLLIILFRAWTWIHRGWRRAGRRGRGARGLTNATRARGARGAMTVRGGSTVSVRPRVSLASRGGVGASNRTGRGPSVRATASSGGPSGGGRRTGAGRAAPVAATSNSGQSDNPVVLDP